VYEIKTCAVPLFAHLFEWTSVICLFLAILLDGQSTYITGLLQQDGQYLHVEDPNADGANAYVSADNSHMTYIGEPKTPM